MTDWLIDKSALVRMVASADAEAWVERSERGLIRIATPSLLETGYSARSMDDWSELMSAPPVSWYPVEYLTPVAEQRALEVQGELARRGQHRAPSVPDLMIAAIAEQAGLIVLHLDKDFELIAEVTGQPMERLRMS